MRKVPNKPNKTTKEKYKNCYTFRFKSASYFTLSEYLLYINKQLSQSSVPNSDPHEALLVLLAKTNTFLKLTLNLITDFSSKLLYLRLLVLNFCTYVYFKLNYFKR
jgi:hypothetical protein